MLKMKQFTNVLELIEWIQSQRRFDEKKSLDKIKYCCELFDNPQDKFKSIHVSGTNGKGSVVSYLRSILMKANLKVATFTSPYITVFNERISINGKPISDDDLLKTANLIISKYPLILDAGYSIPSFFEFITILAFIYFSQQDIDIAVIEVGIGGLLDSTNVISPLLSIITNVSYDHMNVLGNTLEEILINKLGIVKENTPLVTGVKDNNLRKIIVDYCHNKNSNCFFTKDYKLINSEIGKMTFNYQEYDNLSISLNGFHQIENAACAIEAIDYLFDIIPDVFNKANLSKTELIKNGLNDTFWPGRFEIISTDPLIIIDGAHNEDGIKRIVEYVNSLNYKLKRCTFACSDDKEKEEMLKLLANSFDEIIITEYTYKRHSPSSKVFNLIEHPNKKLITDINEAISYTINNPSEFNLFIGSLYLVSEIRPILKKLIG